MKTEEKEEGKDVVKGNLSEGQGRSSKEIKGAILGGHFIIGKVIVKLFYTYCIKSN